MLKKITYLMLVFIVMITTVGSSSCSKDDTNDYYYTLASLVVEGFQDFNQDLALRKTIIDEWKTLYHANSQNEVSLGNTTLENAKQKFHRDCDEFSEYVWIRYGSRVPEEGQINCMFYMSDGYHDYRFIIRKSGVSVYY